MSVLKQLNNDLPPPYTPTESTSTPRQSAPLLPTPPHHAVQEQPGYLGETPTTTTTNTTTTTSDTATANSNTHPQNNLGPIGSIVELAGNIVGTAADVALGVTSAVTSTAFAVTGAAAGVALGTADAGFSATRQASALAVNGAKIVGDYIRGDTTKSNSKLYIKQSNSPLELNETWSGRECQLKNSSGHIIVHGSLYANKNIVLENHNGNINIDGQLLASGDINVKVSKGTFVVLGQSIIAKFLSIENSNSPIQFSNFIEAKKINLKTKNAPVILSHVSVGSSMYIKTSNSPVEVLVDNIISSSAKIEIETSNAPVKVYLPSKFSGRFDIRSKNGLVRIVAKSGDPNKYLLSIEEYEESRKTGKFKHIGKKSNNVIIVKTSKAPATIYIQ